MISKIEVALRVRLVEALLIHGEPLVLQDSSILKKKKLYWKNMSTVASEIARLMMFIKHNFDNHDGRCLYGQLLKFFLLVRYRR